MSAHEVTKSFFELCKLETMILQCVTSHVLNVDSNDEYHLLLDTVSLVRLDAARPHCFRVSWVDENLILAKYGFWVESQEHEDLVFQANGSATCHKRSLSMPNLLLKRR